MFSGGPKKRLGKKLWALGRKEKSVTEVGASRTPKVPTHGVSLISMALECGGLMVARTIAYASSFVNEQGEPTGSYR